MSFAQQNRYHGKNIVARNGSCIFYQGTDVLPFTKSVFVITH